MRPSIEKIFCCEFGCCSTLFPWRIWRLLCLEVLQGCCCWRMSGGQGRCCLCRVPHRAAAHFHTFSSFLMRASAQQHGNLHGMADSKRKEHKLIRGTRGPPGPQGEGWAMDAAASSFFSLSEAAGLAHTKPEWMTEREWWGFSKCLPRDQCQLSPDKDTCSAGDKGTCRTLQCSLCRRWS